MFPAISRLRNWCKNCKRLRRRYLISEPNVIETGRVEQQNASRMCCTTKTCYSVSQLLHSSSRLQTVSLLVRCAAWRYIRASSLSMDRVMVALPSRIFDLILPSRFDLGATGIRLRKRLWNPLVQHPTHCRTPREPHKWIQCSLPFRSVLTALLALRTGYVF